LEDQPALALRLERALFDQGFEVLHLDDHGSSSDVLLDTLRAAHRFGAVFIYSGHSLDTETKQQLASQVSFRLLDLSRAEEDYNDAELFRRAFALADSLRLVKPGEHQERDK
jgi:hypothetical protein